MAKLVEQAAIELIETGTEPEFVATHIARYDQLPNGWVRLYIGSHRSKGVDRIEYSVLVAPDDLSQMARECLDIAANAHNANVFRGLPKAVAN
jgi:hypothetical protein